jgi:hypothetical protein
LRLASARIAGVIVELVFDSTSSPDPVLPAGRGAPSEQECRELWARAETSGAGNYETDWFAAYDPALVGDEQIVEMMADILDEDTAQSATSSTSKPSEFSRYVA